MLKSPAATPKYKKPGIFVTAVSRGAIKKPSLLYSWNGFFAVYSADRRITCPRRGLQGIPGDHIVNPPQFPSLMGKDWMAITNRYEYFVITS